MYAGIFKRKCPASENSRKDKKSKSDSIEAQCSPSTASTTEGVASSSTSSTAATSTASRTVYHYPATLPFPVVMDDAFPAEEYRSSNAETKSCVHWGQRKLLLSEIQLLCLYCKPDVPYHIVYAGSAPGTHLGFLDEMFARRHTWELIDPGQFDRAVLEPRPNFTLRNEFFTNATAYGINARRLSEVLPALGAVYEDITLGSMQEEKKEIHERLQDIVGTLDVARGTEDIPSMYEPPLALPRGLELLAQVGLERNKPLLFVSDIRSGSVALPNFEDHVWENMRAQECWTTILHGAYSMLKFRLPYTHKAKGFGGAGAVAQTHLIAADGIVVYLDGDVVLPIWTRPTSTEGRLVVRQGARQKPYKVRHVENQFFFFNARVREQVHFNHLLLPDQNLDHHFDAAAEVNCLLSYLYFMYPALKGAAEPVIRAEVRRVSASITEHLGITFTDAIRRRDALMINQARNGAGEEEEDDEDGSDDKTEGRKAGGCGAAASEWETAMRRQVELGTKERMRVVWSANVDEATFNEPSGFWVTTRIRQ